MTLAFSHSSASLTQPRMLFINPTIALLARLPTVTPSATARADTPWNTADAVSFAPIWTLIESLAIDLSLFVFDIDANSNQVIIVFDIRRRLRALVDVALAAASRDLVFRPPTRRCRTR